MKLNAKTVTAATAALGAATGLELVPEFSPQLLGALAPIINKYDLNTISAAVLVAVTAIAFAVLNRIKVEQVETALETHVAASDTALDAVTQRLAALEGTAGD